MKQTIWIVAVALAFAGPVAADELFLGDIIEGQTYAVDIEDVSYSVRFEPRLDFGPVAGRVGLACLTEERLTGWRTDSAQWLDLYEVDEEAGIIHLMDTTWTIAYNGALVQLPPGGVIARPVE